MYIPSSARTAVVFVGPTLDITAAHRELNATFLPPAAHGDIYKAAKGDPWAIGLIDGYFETELSVWHKEILWALQRGIHVFGSASMGALRAAELATFGMVGIGAIFEAYQDGTLEDDDEVTIAHGIPSEPGQGIDGFEFPQYSEAMVNMRFTLKEAVQQGVLRADQAQRWIELAKSLFYPERTYNKVLSLARQEPDLTEVCQHLDRWLKAHRIDQKRRDALDMLRTMRALQDTSPTEKTVRFHFQRTTFWLQFRSRLDTSQANQAIDPNRPPPKRSLPDALLEELRLSGSPYLEVRRRAQRRLWAIELADRHALEADNSDQAKSQRRSALAARLEASGHLDLWSRRQGLTPTQLDRLLSDQERIQHLEALSRTSLDMQVRDYLRLQGLYGDLSARTVEKNQNLEQRGLDEPNFGDLGLDEETVWFWYFETYLERTIPQDLEAYAKRFDFTGLEALRRAVLREYCWCGPMSEDGPKIPLRNLIRKETP